MTNLYWHTDTNRQAVKVDYLRHLNGVLSFRGWSTINSKQIACALQIRRQAAN